METKQLSSEKEQLKREVIKFQFNNMLKKNAKPFATLLKMLLRADKEQKEIRTDRESRP